jgi:CcmD family protein
MDNIFNFLEKNSYYVVLIITLIIWLGIFLYLFRLDKKVKKLEQENRI